VVDPTWPAASRDWQFWAEPAPIPRAMARTGRHISGRTWVRIAIGVVALGLIISRFVSGGSSSNTGIGSCWTPSTGTSYSPVACSDSSARYRVVSQVADPNACPVASTSYLDSGDAGSTRYQCLVPVSH
jgi:hypothetical protein